MLKKRLFLIFYMLLVIPLVSACFSETSTDSNDGGTTTISAPTGVTATDGTYPTAIFLTWNAVTGASSYKIYRSTSSASGYTYVGYVTSAYTNAIFRSTDSSNPITLGTTYYFKVTAVDSSDNESDYSTYDYGYTSMASGQAAIKFWNRFSGYSITEIRVWAYAASDPTCDYLTPSSYGSDLLTSNLAYNYFYMIYMTGGTYVDWYVLDSYGYYNYDDHFSTYASHYYSTGDCYTLLWYGSTASYYPYDYYFTSKGGESDQGKEADFCVVQQPDGSFINVALPKTDEKTNSIASELK